MVKKNNGTWILLGLVAIIVLFATGTFSLSSGFTALSLQKVDFISNDLDVGGEAFLLTVVQKANSVSGAKGSFGRFDSERISDDGKTATKDFEITAELLEQKCSYTITNQGSTIKDVSTKTGKCNYGFIGIGDSCTPAKNSCTNSNQRFYITDNLLNINVPAIDEYYSCMTMTNKATYGVIEEKPKVDFKTRITVKTEGESPSTGVISNTGSTSISLAGGKVRGEWQGSLVTGDNCPSVKGFDAAYYQGSWRVIDETDYNTYKSYDSLSEFSGCIQKEFDFRKNQGRKAMIDASNICKNRFNNYANNALNQEYIYSFGGLDEKSTGTSGSGKITVNLNRMILNPVLTFKVNADYLGIFTPVGKPRITKMVARDFQSGDRGNIAVTVKNIGDALGGFDVNLNCPSPFSVNIGTQGTNVQPGSSKTISFPIVASTTGEQCVTCTAEVYDVNQPNSRDSESVNICASEVFTCPEGEIICEGELTKQCIAGEYVPIISDECKDGVPPEPVSDWFYWVLGGIVVLGILVAVIIRTQNKKGRGRRK